MVQTELIAEIRLLARAEELKRVRDAVRELVAQRGCNAKIAECVVLAVDEACMNIIQHAYHNDPAGEIVVQILNNRDELVFRLIDFAAPVDKTCIRSRDLDDIRPGGLGVHLMSEVMDEVRFVEPPAGAGNALEMRKKTTPCRQ